jgi:hypothetical protein
MTDSAKSEIGLAPRPTSCDLPHRRRIYKFLDKTIRRLWQGNPPEECAFNDLVHQAPLLKSDADIRGLDASVWNGIYGAAVDLIKHDDNLNWQKFYHMVYLNAGLIAAFVLTYRAETTVLAPRLVFPILGLIFSIVFDLTLQEGMRCLRSHRIKVEAMDKKIGIEKGFLFYQNPYNHRDALEAGPLLLAVGWVTLFIAALPRT